MNARVRTSLQSMKTPSKNVKVSFFSEIFELKIYGVWFVFLFIWKSIRKLFLAQCVCSLS